MAHGVPVVAAAGGAHLETVADVGVLFPVGDAAAAAGGLVASGLGPGARRLEVGTALRRRQQACSTPLTTTWPELEQRVRRRHGAEAWPPGPEPPHGAAPARAARYSASWVSATDWPRVRARQRPGTGGPQPFPQSGLVEETGQCRAQGGGVAGGDQQTLGTHHVRERPAGTGHHRDARRLGLGHHPPELLDPPGHGHRRNGQDVDPSVDVCGMSALRPRGRGRSPGRPGASCATRDSRAPELGSGAEDVEAEPPVGGDGVEEDVDPLVLDEPSHVPHPQ